MDFPQCEIEASQAVLVDYSIIRYSINVESPALNNLSRTLGLEITPSEISKSENGNEKSCSVLLSISVGGEKHGESSEWPLELMLEGVFESYAELSDNEFAHMVATNGVQELYAVAKGTLAMLTAGTPVGRLMLPSIQLI